MSYLMIELSIVATALILFVVSFCGFLQKWRLYVQGLEEQNGPNVTNANEKSLEGDAPPPSYVCTIQVDLPPKYDDAVKMPQLTDDVILKVQNLPMGREHSQGRVEIV